MKGTQKPDAPSRESMVVRVDRRLYQQCLEWSQAEGIHVRAVVDAVLWYWFTSLHHNPHARLDAKQRAQAISESIKSQGRSKAEEMLPRWRKPRVKPLVPEPIPIPPPPKG